jgi:predicted metalloprotease
MFSAREHAHMQWDESDRRSDNVEDQRGRSIGRGAAIGGGSVVIALVLALVGAPRELVQAVLNGGQRSGPAVERPVDPAEAPVVDMVKVILADTEDVWQKVLGPGQYRAPKLELFSDQVESACGLASSAVGPFYCPGDQKVYLDLSFFHELEDRFGAPGNFAQAYVIAHEIGHHVQTLTGVSDRVQSMRARGGKIEGNKLSVRQELQADCYAGLWAHHTARMKAKRIVAGDIERGLTAAAAIGDDTLQKRSRGVVVPESFTHGSSAQRVEWFKRGFTSGNMDACDTFDAQGI